MTTVTVIQAKCYNHPEHGWTTYSANRDEQTFDTLEQARAFGESQKRDGMCIIVRPGYNETDEKGRFFREWRSFSGGEFQECRWNLPWDPEDEQADMRHSATHSGPCEPGPICRACEFVQGR